MKLFTLTALTILSTATIVQAQPTIKNNAQITYFMQDGVCTITGNKPYSFNSSVAAFSVTGALAFLDGQGNVTNYQTEKEISRGKTRKGSLYVFYTIQGKPNHQLLMMRHGFTVTYLNKPLLTCSYISSYVGQ